jgi:hypothetical protein
VETLTDEMETVLVVVVVVATDDLFEDNKIVTINNHHITTDVRIMDVNLSRPTPAIRLISRITNETLEEITRVTRTTTVHSILATRLLFRRSDSTTLVATDHRETITVITVVETQTKER